MRLQTQKQHNMNVMWKVETKNVYVFNNHIPHLQIEKKHDLLNHPKLPAQWDYIPSDRGLTAGQNLDCNESCF